MAKEKESEVLFKDSPKWYKVSRRTSLLINKSKVDEAFIPKDIAYEDNKKTVEQVAIAIAHRMPVLLIGETGTGKTSLVRHLAFETHNAFVRVNFNGGMTVEDLIGRWVLEKGETRWVDGLLIMAMKKGYWFLADEINAANAEINFVLHSLLDDDSRIVLAEKGDEVVVPHSNFRFFSAMNPPAEYAGAKELNKALLSRHMVVNVDFPAPKTEQKILMDRTGVDQDVAERMVRFAGEIRVNHGKEQTRFVLSTRDLIMWGMLFKVYKKYMLSAEMSILNKVSTDDFDSIRDLLSLNFKTIDAQVKNADEEVEPEDAKKPGMSIPRV